MNQHIDVPTAGYGCGGAFELASLLHQTLRAEIGRSVFHEFRHAAAFQGGGGDGVGAEDVASLVRRASAAWDELVTVVPKASKGSSVECSTSVCASWAEQLKAKHRRLDELTQQLDRVEREFAKAGLLCAREHEYLDSFQLMPEPPSSPSPIGGNRRCYSSSACTTAVGSSASDDTGTDSLWERYLEDVAAASRVEAVVREEHEAVLQRSTNSREHVMLKESLAQARRSRRDMRVHHRAELLRLYTSLQAAGVEVDIPESLPSSADVSEDSSDPENNDVVSKATASHPSRRSPQSQRGLTNNGPGVGIKNRRKAMPPKVPALFSSMSTSRQSPTEFRSVSRSSAQEGAQDKPSTFRQSPSGLRAGSRASAQERAQDTPSSSRQSPSGFRSGSRASAQAAQHTPSACRQSPSGFRSGSTRPDSSADETRSLSPVGSGHEGTAWMQAAATPIVVPNYGTGAVGRGRDGGRRGQTKAQTRGGCRGAATRRGAAQLYGSTPLPASGWGCGRNHGLKAASGDLLLHASTHQVASEGPTDGEVSYWLLPQPQLA